MSRARRTSVTRAAHRRRMSNDAMIGAAIAFAALLLAHLAERRLGR